MHRETSHYMSQSDILGVDNSLQTMLMDKSVGLRISGVGGFKISLVGLSTRLVSGIMGSKPEFTVDNSDSSELHRDA